MIRTRLAVCMACMALGVSLLMGLKVDNPATVILTRALGAMAIFYMIGGILGTIAETVIEEHFRLKQEEHEAMQAAQAAQDRVELDEEAETTQDGFEQTAADLEPAETI